MDNEAPNYAKWIPDLGGYVANGTIVSKTPMYDSQGKFQIDIDTSILNQGAANQAQKGLNANVGATATNGMSTSKKVGTTESPISSMAEKAGITLANTKGSGTDANAMTTNIGANTSLDLNTENPDESALSSPATKSPQVGVAITNPIQKANQDYLDAAGRNDLQGEINALTTLGRLTGQDYSTQIQELTRQREQKIRTIDDQYLAKINQAQAQYDAAVRSGDQNAIAQAQANLLSLQAEQQKWRSAVGYQGAMQTAKQRDLEDQQIKWENNYMDGINQIAQTLTQLVGNYLNFQYNPYQDSALQIAQGYATSRVKEQMNSTGMFYSTMTQNAISKAVAELVPVYEKMAKEEMREQISLLQSTASFLMNLEQTQFNMWKSQIELQWEANAEKRAQIKAAIDAANARGYYTNEEAALVGVEPGSLSQQAREHQQELQEELDRENRAFAQQIALADYKNTLDLENYAEKQKIQYTYNMKEWAAKGGNKPSAGDYPTYAQIKSALEETLQANPGLTQEQLIEAGQNMGLSPVEASTLALDLVASKYNKDKEKEETAAKADKEERDKMLDYINQDTLDLIQDTSTAKIYANHLKKTGDSKLANEDKNLFLNLKNASQHDKSVIISDLLRRRVIDRIDENATKYSDDADATSSALNNSISLINDYTKVMKDTGIDYYNYLAPSYAELISTISNAEEFDTSKTDFNDGSNFIKIKQLNIDQILDGLTNNEDKNISGVLAPQVQSLLALSEQNYDFNKEITGENKAIGTSALYSISPALWGFQQIGKTADRVIKEIKNLKKG